MDEEEIPEFKVVLLGKSGVGKTSIVNTAVYGNFDPNSESTVGASLAIKSVQTKNGNVSLQIWDTAGQEKYRGMTPLYFRDANAAIAVFSVDDPDSFNDLGFWIKMLNDNLSTSYRLYIIGNKSDLDKKVMMERVNGLSQSYDAPYFSVSAKSNSGISELFMKIATDCLEDDMLSKAAESTPTVVKPVLKTQEEKKCC